MRRSRPDRRGEAPSSGVSHVTSRCVLRAIRANYRATGSATSRCTLIRTLGIAPDDLSACLDDLESTGHVRRIVGGSVLPVSALVGLVS